MSVNTGIAASLLVAALGLPTNAGAITVWADADGDQVHDSQVQMGVSDSVTLTIYAEIASEAAVISYGVRGSYEADLGRDLLTVPSGGVVSNSIWLLPESIDTDNVEKTADVFDGTLGTGVFGTAVPLFSITFQSDNLLGEARFIMGDSFPDNLAFDGWVSPTLGSLDGTISYQETEIRVVPIPTAGLLFASSLLALFGLKNGGRGNFSYAQTQSTRLPKRGTRTIFANGVSSQLRLV